ncbi:MAG: DUF4148 domain-containing protein [Rhodoferax sp.]
MKKNAYAAAIALALTTLAAGQVLAADNSVQGKTRDQVRAELAEAQRTGDIVVSANAGDELGVGRKLNEVAPSRYPAKAVAQGKTRAQVKAELAEAQRTGDIVVSANAGDELGVGRKLNEVAPATYTPAKADPQGKTRAQVKAELAEAQRNGDIVVGNSGDELGTGRKLNQVFPARYSAKAVN